MIYPGLKLYLKTKFSNPSLNFQWTDEDNKDFFSYIRKNSPKHHILDDNEKAEIKQAFKNYFEPIAYIIFTLKEKQIRIKVIKYKIKPKDSINLESIIDIIDGHENLIKFNYKNNENQILITKDLKCKIYNFVQNLNNEEINHKDLIKHALREALELEESDIIIIKEDSIFIKLVTNLKRKIISLEEKDTITNRYNGISEDELIFFYTEYFSQEENKNFFYLVAKVFVDIYFIDEKITNADYEKNVFAFIQEIIINQLIEAFDYNENFFKGFSGYILRIHFQEVFSFIADFVLNEISISSSYMVDFLKYYSLNVVVLNGVKYKVPDLEADNGLKWNTISIMSVAKVYMKVKQSADYLQEDLYEIDDELYGMCINEQSPIEYNNYLFKHKNEITIEIAEEIKELKICSDEYDLAKNNDEKKELKEEMHEITDYLQELKDKRDDISKKIIDKSIISTYKALEKEMKTCYRQLKAEKKILLQNVNSYKSVKNALTKALISKKKCI